MSGKNKSKNSIEAVDAVVEEKVEETLAGTEAVEESAELKAEEEVIAEFDNVASEVDAIAETIEESAEIPIEVIETAPATESEAVAEIVEETEVKAEEVVAAEEKIKLEPVAKTAEDVNADAEVKHEDEAKHEGSTEENKFEESTEEVNAESTEPTPEVTPLVDIETPKKEKKNFFKTHKLLTAIVAVVLLLLIGGGVTALILLKGQILVKDANAIEKAIEKGKTGTFVLTNDVTFDKDFTLSKGYDINLKGHTLTINGKFSYELGEGNDEIYIGTIRKNEKKAAEEPGAVCAKEFVFNGVNAKLEVNSPFTAEVVNISANAIGIKTLNADTVTLSGSLASIESINAVKEEAVTVNVPYMSELKICTVTGNVILGDDVSLRVDKANSVMGGKVVFVEDKVTAVDGVDKLIVSYNGTVENVKNVENVILQEKLAKPLTVIVDSSTKVPTVTIGEVANATAYKYKIGDFEGISHTSTFEIGTTLTPSEYTIFVKAVVDTEGNEKYVDSDYIEYNFNYSATLAKPELSISGTVLSISEVEHADYYGVSINGGEEIKVEGNTLDLTEYLSTLGSYDLVVTARSSQTYYLASTSSMVTYRYTKVFDAPVLTESAVEDGYEISWTAVVNAKYYKVVYTDAEAQKTVYTTGTSVVVPTATTVTVSVMGYGYYIDSAVASITPVASEPEI